MTLAPDATISGRYTLVERIAVGGMGEVWRARDDVLGRAVAVKVLKEEYAADPTFLQRFRDEARHTAALSHPGIANVFDYGEIDGTAFLVMELVDGAPLSALLAQQRPLPVGRALDIVGQAALALQAAHDAGVIHRDVKPGNLLIRPDGVVKVTDFGIARATDAAPVTQTGLIVGTAAYVSPEQAGGRPVTPASDVYSLGVVAYECLAGERPFGGDSAVGVATAHLHSPPPPLPAAVPPLVADFVLRALAKDPARRQPSAGDFGRTALALAAQLRDPAESVGVPAPTPAPAPTSTQAPAPAPAPTRIETAATATDDEAERRRVRNIFIAIGAAVVIVGFLLLRACADTSTPAHRSATPSASAHPPARVTVRASDYIGRPFEEARRSLRHQHLRVDRIFGPAIAPAGTVTGVDPTGPVKEGATVTLTVAAAPAPTHPSPRKEHGRGHGEKHGHDD
ncbi:MAG TPA: protein kinase [Mycobacteriales bacterium]|nr:protein kinase [Mycobacteriales bacterium]